MVAITLVFIGLATLPLPVIAADNTTSQDLWTMFPAPVWLIFGAVVGVLVMLVIVMLAAPKKKRPAGTQAGGQSLKNRPQAGMPQDMRQQPRQPMQQPPMSGPQSGQPDQMEPMAFMQGQPQQQPMQPRPVQGQPMQQQFQPQQQPMQPRPVQGQPMQQQFQPQQQPMQPQPVQRQPMQQQFQPQQQPMQPQPVQGQPMQQQFQPQQQPMQPRPMQGQPMQQFPQTQAQAQAQAQPFAAQPVGGQMQYTAPFRTSTPPSFSLSNIIISPDNVKEGDPVTISAVVTNTGATAGQYSLVLRINSVVEKVNDLTINPGSNQTSTFTIVRDIAGEYYIELDGLRGMFVVTSRKPPTFSVSNLTIAPERVKQGEPIAISAVVTNSGETMGNYSVVLRIKGVAEGIEEVNLGPGRSQRVTFNIIKDTAGFYPVTLENMTGKFVVQMDWKE